MTTPTRVVLRARKYWCLHKLFQLRRRDRYWFVVPYWIHRAYEIEIAGHGWTMAPARDKITEWALDWLACNPDNDGKEWVVEIQWV